MDILLVRHAESVANVQGIYQGQSYDTELSNKGVKQAEAVARSLNKMMINKVYTSPLKRTRQTATAIVKRLLLEEALVDKRLAEINHGEWEGKTKQQIESKYPDEFRTWKQTPEAVTMPGGENIKDVQTRAFEFLGELDDSQELKIAVVTHDAVIRAILTKLLRRELNDLWMFELDAAGYSIIEWNSKLPTVVKINENEHLNGLTSDLEKHAL